MIDLYYWTTPNGHKITIFLEEAGMEYRLIPVNIGRGEQFEPSFLAVAPNNRIPAIVDNAPDAAADASGKTPLFESGAILLYLADKTGQFLPKSGYVRYEVIQWLMWQMGGLGPMLGQNHHFRSFAPEKVPYAQERYEKETQRLYAVLNRRLQNRDYISGAYSIADMACYPWTVPYEMQGIDINNYPEVKRWQAAIAARPAVIRAYDKAATVSTAATVDDEARKFLYGQTDAVAPK